MLAVCRLVFGSYRFSEFMCFIYRNVRILERYLYLVEIKFWIEGKKDLNLYGNLST